MMKIFLRQIPESGLSFDQEVTAQELDIPKDVLECFGPLAIRVDIEHVGDEVLAKIEVRGQYCLSCARCLEDFKQEKTDCFDLAFDVEPTTEFIDITGDVRDEIILAASFNPVCREDCKGLCLSCGANLNNEECKCKKCEDVKA